jgi:hypothetical protein
MKLYQARHKETGEVVVTSKKLQFYTSVGACKGATKRHLKNKNKHIRKDLRYKFEEYEVVEYTLSETEKYPL